MVFGVALATSAAYIVVRAHRKRRKLRQMTAAVEFQNGL
ncbi:hypothetical protein C7476_106157 [Phyllobacterium bourgognense]|uniref:Uncharacterized protein n=1 Tax=Phyllobacterium bourgognense TaxID=314236 RepID=A0A368YSE5_9HYPH|nr:hypothetical protein C7476_106157 [Phyllobacterium bourgognense]